MRKKKMMMGVAAMTLAFLGFTATSASAAEVVIVHIGGSTVVGGSNTFKDDSGKTNVYRTTATFSEVKSTSARLVSFRVCFSRTGGGQATLSPYTRNSTGASGTFWDSGVYKVITSGTCYTYKPNKVYKKGSNGEIVRVVNRITPNREETVGFYR
ncbi:MULTISPECIES: hypothetical protein [Curtobacterium]|jgi:hypothetical protein|uniref:hypothetical protein n=1 Tax=Curtobacterium TaxID=2034 RepID=UPI000DA8852B|nr:MULTISPECIES: hypothetical protein [Curtobacterium]MBO9049713.1 hypothetical protein [Curtobacterium flaccumfaciens pv. flaccumfaciens]PZF41387.1 hypothetical protein DEJ07_08555 [Curtobacterium sp. MCLR17_053]WIE58912.1 hypothetical protein DEI96_004600 [Curtobacterium sp. MCLR17_031]